MTGLNNTKIFETTPPPLPIKKILRSPPLVPLTLPVEVRRWLFGRSASRLIRLLWTAGSPVHSTAVSVFRSCA